jgi:hypothetical protein
MVIILFLAIQNFLAFGTLMRVRQAQGHCKWLKERGNLMESLKFFLDWAPECPPRTNYRPKKIKKQAVFCGWDSIKT